MAAAQGFGLPGPLLEKQRLRHQYNASEIQLRRAFDHQYNASEIQLRRAFDHQYNASEIQLRRAFDQAAAASGTTGENLVNLLERR